MIYRALSATGVIRELTSRCPPPTPTAGVVAELRDLATWRVLWTIEGWPGPHHERQTGGQRGWPLRARHHASGDGRRVTTALVSMRDGCALQRMENIWSSERSLGFGPDSRSIWIAGGRFAASYRIEDRPSFGPQPRARMNP